MTKIDWNKTEQFGDHDTVGRLVDGRWFWTWNLGSAMDAEELLELGPHDGEDGGLIFGSFEDLLKGMEGRDDLVRAVVERFSEPL